MRSRLGSVWDTLLLAAGGVLAGHFVAYRLEGGHVHGDGVTHAHVHDLIIPSLTAVVVPLALFALARTALHELRSGRRLLSLRHLVGTQIALFLIQETGERLASGGDIASLFTSPVLWFGVLAQVLAAGLLLGLVRGIERVACVAAPLPVSRVVPLPVRSNRLRSVVRPGSLHTGHWIAQRGPPLGA